MQTINPKFPRNPIPLYPISDIPSAMGGVNRMQAIGTLACVQEHCLAATDMWLKYAKNKSKGVSRWSHWEGRLLRRTRCSLSSSTTWNQPGKRAHLFAHAYIHTYIHTCIHTYLHTYIHTYIPTCMHACMHTYMCVYIHMKNCTYIYFFSCIYIYKSICTFFVYRFAFLIVIYIYMYICVNV